MKICNTLSSLCSATVLILCTACSTQNIGSSCDQYSEVEIAYTNALNSPASSRWPFGGISGLDYSFSQGKFYAITDDRSNHGPARYYRFDLAIQSELKGFTEHVLHDPLGQQFLQNSVDAEAIRVHPEGWIIWSSELPEHTPNIYTTNTDTGKTTTFVLPEHIYPKTNPSRGARTNKFIEALSFTPDYKTLFFVLEAPLYQDGEPPSTDRGANTRILMFDTDTRQLVSEFTYALDPIPTPSNHVIKLHDNGVSEILALDSRTLFVLERSGRHIGQQRFAYDTRMYCIQIEKSTASTASVTKTPVLIREKGIPVALSNNFEGMTRGPKIDGKPAIYLISDNNFNSGQETKFLALKLL